MKLRLLKTRDGAVTWNVSPDTATALLAAGEYDVTVKRVSNSQSERQRGLLRLWFAAIADVTGTPADEVHDWYCNEFLSYHTEFAGGAVISRGTSGLNKAQMSDFMDRVQKHAREFLGITLPDPHDAAFIQQVL